MSWLGLISKWLSTDSFAWNEATAPVISDNLQFVSHGLFGFHDFKSIANVLPFYIRGSRDLSLFNLYQILMHLLY